MRGKLIFVGGLVFYVATMIVGFGVTGPAIHEGVLDATYQANEDFWRPELRTDPPDIGALMPRWLTVGLLSAFVTAAIYSCVASALGGVNLMSGIKYGVMVGVLGAMLGAGWSGIFDLPNSIWLWWAVDGLILNVVGGAAMGWVGGRFLSD